MARYRRRRRYRRYRRYKRFYRRAKNLINASSRSRVTIKARATYSDSFVIPAGQNFSGVVAFNPFVARNPNLSPQLANASGVYAMSTVDQPLVQNFCHMYDEIKVDSCVMKITVTSPIPTTLQALRVWTAWDRHGCYNDTYAAATYPTSANIQTLPSANVVMLSNNTVNTFYRFCKASDFFEKFCFFDATQKVDTLMLYSLQVPACTYVEAWQQANANLISFSPTLFCCCESVNFAPTSNLLVNVSFEMTTYYTFRNPKYGQSSETAKLREKKKVEEMTAPGVPGFRIGVEDAIAEGDPIEIGTTTKGRNAEQVAAMLGVDTAELEDIYAASDTKKHDETAPRSRRRRVVHPGSSDADINITEIPPAAVPAAVTAGLSKNE